MWKLCSWVIYQFFQILCCNIFPIVSFNFFTNFVIIFRYHPLGDRCSMVPDNFTEQGLTELNDRLNGPFHHLSTDSPWWAVTVAAAVFLFVIVPIIIAGFVFWKKCKLQESIGMCNFVLFCIDLNVQKFSKWPVSTCRCSETDKNHRRSGDRIRMGTSLAKCTATAV